MKKLLGEIEIAARRAAELCGQMLAYSGKGAFMLEPIDVRQLIEGMGHLLEASISKKAELVLDLEDDLPLFKGDPSQIRQVVVNLLTNASESLGDTGSRVTIRTGRAEYDDKALRRTFLADERREGSYVYLEIVDDGCGMDQDTQERMFDPFFSTKFTGRGLGLGRLQVAPARRHPVQGSLPEPRIAFRRVESRRRRAQHLLAVGVQEATNSARRRG